MVVLSDKTSRFHLRHVVLKPTQADEFEMPIRCEWISHRPLPTGKSGFLLMLLVVGVVAGAHGGSWPKTDLPILPANVGYEGVKRKWLGHCQTDSIDPFRRSAPCPVADAP